jgi:serine/threonine protein kinase/Leucine-rich repeat (LRR) protein
MVTEHADASGSNERLYGVVLDFLESAERGALGKPAEVVARHPELAPELEQFFDTWVKVERLTEPVRSASQALRTGAKSETPKTGTGEPKRIVASEPAASGNPGRDSGSGSAEVEEVADGWLARWLRQHPPLAAAQYPFLTVAATAGEIGRLGPYRLLEVIGSGGMGIVFRGEDVPLRRMVAVKVLRTELAADPRSRERFLREARAAAALDHENVIAVYYVGEESGMPFLGMQWLRGMSLEDLLRRAGPIDIPVAVRLGQQIALGLAAAHARGLLHRDIKPANLWVEFPESPSDAAGAAATAALAGRIKILDFGLARAGGDDGQLTRSGATMGTPAYMAPEQAAGGEVDQRSDLFALGVVLYRMCIGRLPLSGRSSTDATENGTHVTPPSMRDLNPAVPQDLSDLVTELLARDPARRPTSATKVAERLHVLEGGDPLPARASAPPSALCVVNRSKRSGWRAFGAAAVLAMAVMVPLGYLFGGAMIRLATNKGQVVIVVDDPDAQVTLMEDGAVIQDRRGQRTITLSAGEHELQVTVKDTAGESHFFTKKLVLTRGGREVINVRHEMTATAPTPIVSPAGAARPDQPTAGYEATNRVRRAAEWALAAGGKLRVQGNKGRQEVAAAKELPAGVLRLVALDLGGTPVDDAELAHVGALGDLEVLDLHGTRVSDAGLVHLKGLLNLQVVNLSGTTTGDAGLAQLTGLSELRSLDLSSTRVTDNGLNHLKSLPALRSLGLFGTSVTDEGLATIATLTRLEALDLRATRTSDSGMGLLGALTELRSLCLNRVTDEGIRRLPALPKLEALILCGAKITDAALVDLQRLASLREVDLNATQVGDAGLASLAAVKKLRGASLAATAVTDEGLVHLEGAKDLLGLDLSDTRVTDAGLDRLVRKTTLQTLRLAGTRVTNAGVARLEALTSLRHLDLGRTRVTDIGLDHIGTMKQLRELYLNGTKVTNAGLVRVLNLPLPPLSELDLRGARVSAAGAAAVKGILPKTHIQWWEPNRRAAEAVLAAGGSIHVRTSVEGPAVAVKSVSDLPEDYFRLTRVRLVEGRKPSKELMRVLEVLSDAEFDDLEEMDLTGSTVGDADLEALGPLPCRRLVLDRSPICGPGLAHLKQMSTLKELRLGCPTLSFLGVRFVGELKQLERLSLVESGATDASLISLRDLISLRELDLTSTRVSAQGVAALRQALPRCDIKAGPAGTR